MPDFESAGAAWVTCVCHPSLHPHRFPRPPARPQPAECPASGTGSRSWRTCRCAGPSPRSTFGARGPGRPPPQRRHRFPRLREGTWWTGLTSRRCRASTGSVPLRRPGPRARSGARLGRRSAERRRNAWRRGGLEGILRPKSTCFWNGLLVPSGAAYTFHRAAPCVAWLPVPTATPSAWLESTRPAAKTTDWYARGRLAQVRHNRQSDSCAPPRRACAPRAGPRAPANAQPVPSGPAVAQCPPRSPANSLANPFG